MWRVCQTCHWNSGWIVWNRFLQTAAFIHCMKIVLYALCHYSICSGCIYAVRTRHKKHLTICPFCRSIAPYTDEECMKRLMKRVGRNDGQAMHYLGHSYSEVSYVTAKSCQGIETASRGWVMQMHIAVLVVYMNMVKVWRWIWCLRHHITMSWQPLWGAQLHGTI